MPEQVVGSLTIAKHVVKHMAHVMGPPSAFGIFDKIARANKVSVAALIGEFKIGTPKDGSELETPLNIRLLF
jgi:hypothetical protein